ENSKYSIKELVTSVREAMKTVLGIAEENHVFKIRRRQKNGSQYEKLGNKQQVLYIQEYSIQYKINLTDYLDTGIFLDHRESRKILPSLLKNARRVLNLFSYTGAFSLVAAKSGVEFTTSVDMSNTYCNWAKENFELNHLDKYKHIVIRDNVFFFLENIQKKNWKFDFIVLDPPTVSRSKKMLRKFDIQRDHVELIRMCLRYLNPNGKIFFSTNFQKFKLNSEIAKKFQVTDLTENSYSLDFKNKKIHKVYLLET
ncbi:MAG: class I SAM-dependent methyltransferase, partial [Leptospiraceae bacterium]|nr:class I SAM-dependent methyltransferase [Leptospiraceae bacterium]